MIDTYKHLPHVSGSMASTSPLCQLPSKSTRDHHVNIVISSYAIIIKLHLSLVSSTVGYQGYGIIYQAQWSTH